ncbi:MAG: hypothetical protein ACTS5I_13205 [Rhodanobacter sp.]
MNRRGFFGALSALGAALTLGMTKRESEIRYVEFNPPSAKTRAIYWMDGHVASKRFMALGTVVNEFGELVASQVKYGYGTFKLDRIGVYLSDTPQPNFEPITYWIPTDHFEQEVIA